MLNTGRLSVISDARISAFSRVGSSLRRRSAACQDASDRANSGFDAFAPFASGGIPRARLKNVARTIAPGEAATVNDWWEPRCEEIPGYYATVRQDNLSVLGIVGERYRIVQNEEAFQFVDQLLGRELHFETAGSLHGGRRVWVLATLPDHVQVGGDAVRPYVLLMNSQRTVSNCLL